MRGKRKPPIPEILRATVDEALQRNKRRPASPGVSVELKGKGYSLASPHRDLEAWEVQVCDAFGTRSFSTYRVFLDQLADLTERWVSRGRWAPSELELNAMLNIVNGARPRNELEAALAAQMVAIHFLTMRAAAKAMNHGHIDFRNAALAGKLARTYAQQCDTLARLRGRVGKQTIRVRYERHDHRHVHVGEGGVEKGTQAHEPARANATELSSAVGAPLPGPDSSGHALPSSGNKSPWTLFASWRRARNRRADGRAKRLLEDGGAHE